MNKNGAFNKLADRYKSINKPIFIADRGFESSNSFVHVMKSENKFPIHIKEIHSKTSAARSFGLPKADKFNVDVKRILTIRNTNEISAYPEIHKFMPKNQKFDSFGNEKFFDLNAKSYVSKLQRIHTKQYSRILKEMNYFLK